MAYHRKYLLKKIIKIQALVLEAKKKGVTQKFVYENEVIDKYDISYRTFNEYLSTNAKKELEELEKREALREKEKKRQLSLMFD